ALLGEIVGGVQYVLCEHTRLDALAEVDFLLGSQKGRFADTIEVHAHQVSGGTLGVEVGLFGGRGHNVVVGGHGNVPFADSASLAFECLDGHIASPVNGLTCRASRSRLLLRRLASLWNPPRVPSSPAGHL